MAFPKNLSQLCTPSLIYFVISVLAIAISIIQNLGNNSVYSLGSFSCSVPSTILVFIVKIIYILFWTWVLNLICKDGYTSIAWLLVLLPFILLFVIIGLIMLNQQSMQKQNQKQKKSKK
jgi:hypothetical protein